MRKAERAGYIRRRAEELAETGDYRGWLEIETVIRFQEGYSEARQVLDDRFIRDRLDAICAHDREGKAHPLVP